VVSVVIPTYDRRHLVTEAVWSAVSQDVEGLEIIVVDDGSSDGTADHLGALGIPLTLLRLPHSGVIARVRNAGIRQASGPLIAFLDSDDLWLPGKLRRQLDYLAAHPEVGVVYTDQYRQRGDRILPRTRFDDFPPRARVVWRDTLRGLCVQTSSVVVRREIFDAAGLFDEDLLLYEDADLWSRMSEVCQFGAVTEPLVLYRCDVDPAHLQDDARLGARMAREYLRRYEARRRGQVVDDEERRATARFRAALEAWEAELECRAGG
jgi:glycosyltransferase involved in cell wall biosynthesis